MAAKGVNLLTKRVVDRGLVNAAKVGRSKVEYRIFNMLMILCLWSKVVKKTLRLEVATSEF